MVSETNLGRNSLQQNCVLQLLLAKFGPHPVQLVSLEKTKKLLRHAYKVVGLADSQTGNVLFAIMKL